MAGTAELKKILKTHGLRITDCRMGILDHFITERKALVFKNLENRFPEYDRVTLYRTLASFEANGILHRIPSDDGSVKYGLCYGTCDASHHHHDHMHFKCDICGSLECLDEHIPEIKVSNYQIREVNLILNGTCLNCAQS